MNEDYFAMSRQHEIGLARQMLVVQPKPKVHSMYKAAHHHLGLGVSTPNAAHIFAPPL